MNKATSIIEINGRSYDAVSGRLIGAVKKATYQAIKPAQGLSIDGFTRRKTAKDTARSKRSVHGLNRRLEHSKTLMRATVKKPVRAKSEDKIKFRSLSPDHARIDRARRIPKSSKVQRFGLLPHSRNPEAKTGEVIAPSSNLPARSAMAATATLPSVTTSASHYKLERLLDYALAHADAHKKSLDESTRAQRKFLGRLPRWLGIVLIVLVAGIIAGFILWQKMPEASLKLASVQSHIPATMPKLPPGFKAAQSRVENGSVVTEALSGDIKLTYIQKPSHEPTSSLASTNAPATASVQTSIDSSGCTSFSYTDPVSNENVAISGSGGLEKIVKASGNVDLQQLRQSVC